MRAYLLVLGCCLFIIGMINGQEPMGDLPPSIQVIGSVSSNGAIMLRWAPNTPTTWKYSNQYGYRIERHTVSRGDQILNPREIKQLNNQPIKPKPLEQWEGFADRNDLAGVAAQALYGDDFEVEMEEGGNGMMAIINQAQILEQRFTFALFSADLDFEVALFSGLAFVDNDTKASETYLYKIISEIPEDKLNVKFGAVFLSRKDYRPLPKPLELAGIFKDSQVMLSWNYKLLERDYSSYFIERSSDAGRSFQRISEDPVTSLNNTDEQNTSRIVYIDSLPQNGKEYQYRIKGISPFGETGPYSDIIKGKGVKGHYYNPAILDAVLSKDQLSVVITWDFPQEGIEGLSHFEIVRADQVQGDFVPVISGVDRSQRTIIVNDVQSINYYSVTAVGLDGTKRISFPRMVQPDDAIPPADPRGLTGTIDSTGIVTLRWQQNTEKDFLGYRVFRANLEDEEFTQITFRPIVENTIIDTIPIKTLVKKIYYKVQAFDKRYNPSGFSEVLKLNRPDIIPPTPPVITKFKVTDQEVELQWVSSNSEDAIKTLIYKKKKGTRLNWELVADLNIADSRYKDKSYKEKGEYLYTLLTIDESGLESDPIAPVTIFINGNKVKPNIERFNVTANREEKHILLNWIYKEKGVTELLLFRGKGEQKPTLYKVFKDGQNSFVDNKLVINTDYTYLLQAVFSSGSKSPLKKVEITY